MLPAQASAGCHQTWHHLVPIRSKVPRFQSFGRLPAVLVALVPIDVAHYHYSAYVLSPYLRSVEHHTTLPPAYYRRYRDLGLLIWIPYFRGQELPTRSQSFGRYWLRQTHLAPAYQLELASGFDSCDLLFSLVIHSLLRSASLHLSLSISILYIDPTGRGINELLPITTNNKKEKLR